MRRLLRIRLLAVLLALLLVPPAALPFAGELRLAWERYWSPPEPEVAEWNDLDWSEIDLPVYVCPTTYPVADPAEPLIEIAPSPNAPEPTES